MGFNTLQNLTINDVQMQLYSDLLIARIRAHLERLQRIDFAESHCWSNPAQNLVTSGLLIELFNRFVASIIYQRTQ